MTGLRSVIAVVLVVLGATQQANAGDEPLRLAIASNFRLAARELLNEFQKTHPIEVTVSTASTGKLYAQIVNGAPFDILLAADAERPGLLAKSGLAVAESLRTYAVGHLVLWSRSSSVTSLDCGKAVKQPELGRIAMANPATAPYGVAAKETLVALGLWEGIRPRLVFGENVSQALQFAASGNAAFGFVAAAQLLSDSLPPTTCLWNVPDTLHSPIRQRSVLLSRASANPDARAFLDFLQGDRARAIIRRHGYGLEEPAGGGSP